MVNGYFFPLAKPIKMRVSFDGLVSQMFGSGFKVHGEW
jgi:hypothetical protein